MKKGLIPALIFYLALTTAGCKKCFHCTNECVRCSITVGANNFSHILCRDTFNTVAQYNSAIAADTSLGYVCSPTTPTYDYDFCVNNSGKDAYPAYFNKGNKVSCNEK